MMLGPTVVDPRLREAAAVGWDAAVAAMRYEDGTPVEIVAMVNPYRNPEPDDSGTAGS